MYILNYITKNRLKSIYLRQELQRTYDSRATRKQRRSNFSHAHFVNDAIRARIKAWGAQRNSRAGINSEQSNIGAYKNTEQEAREKNSTSLTL